MASYVDSTNIVGYYTKLDVTKPDSIVTKAKIDELIEQQEAIFEAVLGMIGYETLPLTNGADKLIAKQLIEWVVVNELDGILREADQDSQFDFKRNTLKKYDKTIAKFIYGTLQLSEMREQESANTFNSADFEGNAVEPTFKMEDAYKDL